MQPKLEYNALRKIISLSPITIKCKSKFIVCYVDQFNLTPNTLYIFLQNKLNPVRLHQISPSILHLLLQITYSD